MNESVDMLAYAASLKAVKLPHPRAEDFRERYNELLSLLLKAGGSANNSLTKPAHLTPWGRRESLDEFRKRFNKIMLFHELRETFDFSRHDRGVGLDSPLYSTILEFELLIQGIEKAPGTVEVIQPLRFSAHIQGPSEIVHKIERAVDNAALYAFLTEMKRHTFHLGGEFKLVREEGFPRCVITYKGLELSRFRIPFVPTGNDGTFEEE